MSFRTNKGCVCSVGPIPDMVLIFRFCNVNNGSMYVLMADPQTRLHYCR